MMIPLGELQRAYNGMQRRSLRQEIRDYLLHGREPTRHAFKIVDDRLYVDGLIDKHGYSFEWLAGANPFQRVALYGAIITGLLKDGNAQHRNNVVQNMVVKA